MNNHSVKEVRCPCCDKLVMRDDTIKCARCKTLVAVKNPANIKEVGMTSKCDDDKCSKPIRELDLYENIKGGVYCKLAITPTELSQCTIKKEIKNLIKAKLEQAQIVMTHYLFKISGEEGKHE